MSWSLRRANCARTRADGLRRRPAQNICLATVEVLEARQLLTAMTFTVTNTGDLDNLLQPVPGSLRAAILAANANPNGTTGVDTIAFNIGPGGPQTITPTEPLPAITDPVLVLGNTQPGYTNTPLISIDGSSAGSTASGLNITAGATTVWALDIFHFAQDGISMSVNGNNDLIGCIIGTDSTGNTTLGNADCGLKINGTSGNVIGGSDRALGNIFVFNQSDGIQLFQASNSSVTGNELSGNKRDGLEIVGFTGGHDQVQGNFIGTDFSGTQNLGNGEGIAMLFSNFNTVGGTTSAARNIISNNRGAGIHLASLGTLIQGNHIDSNFGDGVFIGNEPNNTIGGTVPGAGNLIVRNQQDGMYVETTGNGILGNSIASNNYLDIDLAPRGVMNPNIPGGPHVGANDLQNYPVLTQALAQAVGTRFAGTLDSTPMTAFRIEFFASGAADPMGFGQFVGFTQVTTDAGGKASFAVTLPSIGQAGHVLRATATDPSNNTSEFSKPIITHAAVADFDGDRKTDFGVYGPYGPGGIARIAVLESGGGAINFPFGTALDTPIAGDFDGDGKTDIGVYGPYEPNGANRFAIDLSGGDKIFQTFGNALDKPAIGDFEGDGKSHLGVYGPYGPNGNNRLLVLPSAGGIMNVTIGGPLDTFVSGDFDGDGKTDIAVYGPYGLNGQNRLAVLLSGGGAIVQPFGGQIDRFVSGDFDGDGKTDIGVYGPYGPGGGGRFAVLESGGGVINKPFGGVLDIPIPPPIGGPGTVGTASVTSRPRAAPMAPVSSGNQAEHSDDSLGWVIVAAGAPTSLSLPAPSIRSHQRHSLLLNDLVLEALASEP
jgi:hypothetical protein